MAWNVSKPIQSATKANCLQLYAKQVHFELKIALIGGFQSIFKKAIFWQDQNVLYTSECVLYAIVCRLCFLH